MMVDVISALTKARRERTDMLRHATPAQRDELMSEIKDIVEMLARAYEPRTARNAKTEA